jgi:Zinc carboxypeptidase
MYKNTRLTYLFSLLISFSAYSQLKSPSEYFGVESGSVLHRHHQMVEYVDYLVKSKVNNAKIIEYGKTTEGRKMFVCVVSSAQNISQLNTIRENNLKSIGLLVGNSSQKSPAIAWLSYNVHGNEPVSMEASMEVLYKLMANVGGEFDQMLSNTVIIIDPCLNPDGRDRYANWYNQKLGVIPNSNPVATEHNEPWPVGRTNHYLFDLNRDWAWQVQDESKQRMALYNSWMPHLHADFHEQSINMPYYFAPSAKPFLENITPWQREFQTKVGEFNKKEFDKNGWLYITKENFDLLYPSYGDTYPTLNGALAMTYEQGGIRGGLSYVTDEEDTLTLKLRLSHHVSSSFAVLAALSANAAQTVGEFVKYFDKSKNNPTAQYQTYVIKSKNSESKIEELLKLLDANGISYGTVNKISQANGFSYQDLTTKSFVIDPNDLVLSMNQPKSTLLKVLFEPKTTIEDSVTYDITAWSLPYAFGLNTYAVKEKIALKPYEIIKNKNEYSSGQKAYAYILKWNSFTDAKLLANLLRQKVKVRQAELPFEMEGVKYDRGTLVVTRAGNELQGDKFDKLIIQIANTYNLKVKAVFTGMVSAGFDLGSKSFGQIKAPKVAIIGGDPSYSIAFGEIWHYFDKQLEYPNTVIDIEMLGNIELAQFTTIILPNGAYSKALNDKILVELNDWIMAGGRLIVMENAMKSFIDKPGFDLKKKEPIKDSTGTVKIYENREREEISAGTPGSIYAVSMESTNPLAFGIGKTYYSLALEATDYALLKNDWNIGVLKENNLVAGFAGKKGQQKLKNSLIFGVENKNKGQVVYMANNPLFRGFWQNGKLLFSNAIFMNK